MRARVAILLCIGAVFAASTGYAASTGEGLVRMLDGLLSGNIGLFVGLVLAVLGVWTWLVKQDSWGIVMIVAGVTVTAFPGIFQGLGEAVSKILQSADVDGATTRETTTETRTHF